MGFFLVLVANYSMGWFGLIAGFITLVGASIVAKSVFRLIGS